MTMHAYLKPLETLSARRGSISTIFADFVRVAACCLAPRVLVDGASVSMREEEYMEVIRRYPKRDLELISEAFGLFIVESEKHPHRDILGNAWLDCTSKSSKQVRGEFYTPPEICDLMAHMTGGAEAYIAEGKPFTVEEPACGAGSMILSFAKQFAPDHWHLPRFTAIDINPVACDMCFINTSLWSIPCEVICGNALFLKPGCPRYVNLHWVRCGEEERRRIQTLSRLLSAPPEPAPDPEPPKPPEPPQKPIWKQADLFAA